MSDLLSKEKKKARKLPRNKDEEDEGIGDGLTAR